MSGTGVRAHPSFGELLDYWFGDMDAAAVDQIDAHLFGCAACGASIDHLAALAGGVRECVLAGRLSVVVTPGFVHRLAAQGLRVREYRVPLNGSVNCTVAADDAVVVGRLQVPLAGVRRLDVASDMAPGGASGWLRDVPFDAASGEVLLLARLAELRLQPAHVLRVRLMAVEAQGARELGHFTFRHSPAPAG